MVSEADRAARNVKKLRETVAKTSYIGYAAFRRMSFRRMPFRRMLNRRTAFRGMSIRRSSDVISSIGSTNSLCFYLPYSTKWHSAKWYPAKRHFQDTVAIAWNIEGASRPAAKVAEHIWFIIHSLYPISIFCIYILSQYVFKSVTSSRPVPAIYL